MPKVISDRVVTAVLPDRFYVADLDRKCAIGVIDSTTSVQEGDLVRVVGSEVDMDGEMVIQASSVLVTAQLQTLRPLGLPSLYLGGSGFGIQSGMGYGFGLNSIGLLIRTWGKVTQIGADYLYVDDGSGLRDGTSTGETENVGVRVICDPAGYSSGEKVEVTGISSCLWTPSGIARRILTRRPEDVRKLTGL